MNVLEAIEAKQMKDELPSFDVGDTVRLNVKVIEGDKERMQPFQGVVIQKSNTRNRATFTVRKVSGGVAVERIFPIHSPNISGVQVLRRGHVRRARLFYLRELRGKAARIRERRSDRTTAKGSAKPAKGSAKRSAKSTAKGTAKSSTKTSAKASAEA